MADEIKKIIEIDATNSVRSLKDYKTHIDQLRASLLNLNQDSKEYKTITQQIQVEQQNLDNALNVGKKQTDAADGSYNQLVATMDRLKEAWRATADETERAQLGSKILDINNKLKDLEESTGDFSRNIGNYQEAFNSAFQIAVDQLRDTSGAVGVLGQDIGKLTPLIMSATRAATTGMAGVKAAIARTGIGLLIVAVGELIFHWREFAKFVGITEQDISKFGQTTLTVLEYIVRAVTGAGAALLNFLVKPFEAAFNGAVNLSKVLGSIMSGDFTKAAEQAGKAIQSTWNTFLKGFDVVSAYKMGDAAGAALIKSLRDRLGSEKVTVPDVKMPKVTGGDSKSETKDDNMADVIKTEEEALNAVRLAAYQEYQDKLKALNEEAKQKRFIESFEEYQTEQERLDAQYKLEEEAVQKKLELQEQALEAGFLSKEKELELEQQHQAALQEQYNLTYKYQAESKKAADKEVEESAKRKEKNLQSSVKGLKGIFGTLADLSEEGSETQKAFAIMETVINTYDSAMQAYKSLAGIPVVGPALGAAAAAAAVVAGIQQVNKIKSTTKENASVSGASTEAPSVPQAALVTPLLNEEADLTRMSNIPVTQESETQNIKVYVTESDISDATHKAEVRDSNSSF